MRSKEKKTVEEHQACPDGQRGERGFTLMETAIALVILMVVSLGAASLFFYAAMNNSGASDRELAMAVAQNTMETYRSAVISSATLTQTASAGTNSTVTAHH